MSIDQQAASPATAPLFTPLQLGSLTLPNRIVMAPMTRGFSPNGVPGSDVAAYYRRRAAHGVGLIVTEGTPIDHTASAASPNWPSFYGQAALEGWAHVVSEVHEAGGRIIPQLWHVGTTRKPGSLPNPASSPVGPSGLTAAGEQVNEPLGEAEIADIIAAFARAASDAKRIGFDGIELHGAHGYLIDQFFWDKTNKRTDRYGGSLVARTRFAAEVIAACRRAVGSDFPIVFRFSQWKAGNYDVKLAVSPDELAQFLAPLVDAGVDIFHCSTRRFWEPEFAGSSLNLAGWTKKLTGLPTITVGSVSLNKEFTSSAEDKNEQDASNIAELVHRFKQNEFDLVAVGRALLADPAWTEKLHTGQYEAIAPYTAEAASRLY
ncbi:12-oxophytodienoate reductase [Paenibacillaceae bacterium]|nr:12-oxophytodienoate reductase [Paenibacillaceae bacterium]